MRTASAVLTSHLGGTGLTLATCLKIVRLDGVSLGLTEHDTPITFAGQLYSPLDPVSASSIRTSLGQGIDSLEISGLLSSAALVDTDLLGGRYDNASFELFQVNYMQSPLVDRLLLATGYLGTCTYEGAGFHAELRGLTSRLGQQIVEQTSATCRVWQLGDSRCKIKLAAVPISAITKAAQALVTTTVPHGRVGGDTVYFSDVGGMTQISQVVATVQTVPTSTSFSVDVNSTGFSTYTSGGQIGYRALRTVASVQSPLGITFASDVNPSQFYQYGSATFATGQNAGIAKEIKSHTLSAGQAVLTLQEAFPFVVAPGDTATLEAGCDRTPATCNARFRNIINARVENLLPGQDVLLRRGRK